MFAAKAKYQAKSEDYQKSLKAQLAAEQAAHTKYPLPESKNPKQTVCHFSSCLNSRHAAFRYKSHFNVVCIPCWTVARGAGVEEPYSAHDDVDIIVCAAHEQLLANQELG